MVIYSRKLVLGSDLILNKIRVLLSGPVFLKYSAQSAKSTVKSNFQERILKSYKPLIGHSNLHSGL